MKTKYRFVRRTSKGTYVWEEVWPTIGNMVMCKADWFWATSKREETKA